MPQVGDKDIRVPGAAHSISHRDLGWDPRGRRAHRFYELGANLRAGRALSGDMVLWVALHSFTNSFIHLSS